MAPPGLSPPVLPPVLPPIVCPSTIFNPDLPVTHATTPLPKPLRPCKHPLAAVLAPLLAPLLALSGAALQAQTTEPGANTPAAPLTTSQATPLTLDLVGTQSRLSNQQPNGSSANLRATYLLRGGDVLRAELLSEDKFYKHGGLAALGYTTVLSPDWVAAGTVALGTGGPNWANQRIDAELSRSWGEARNIVTRAALYKALFDNSRHDSGLRLAVVGYLPGSVVLEGGTALNVSQPGTVHSSMPFASVTVGRDGEQYLSARISAGSEAYLATTTGPVPVQFRSHSAGLTWRRWMAPTWGFIAQAEQYGNPSYRRVTLGAGLFAQF